MVFAQMTGAAPSSALRVVALIDGRVGTTIHRACLARHEVLVAAVVGTGTRRYGFLESHVSSVHPWHPHVQYLFLGGLSPAAQPLLTASSSRVTVPSMPYTKPVLTISCPQCGDQFQQARPHQRFCSIVCKDAWHNNERAMALAILRGTGPKPPGAA